MLNKWINKKYLDQKKVNELRKSFSKAKPYPLLVINDFFNKQKIMVLKQELLKENFEKIDRDLFSFANTRELIGSGNSVIKEFYKFFSSNDFLKFIEKLTGEKKLKKIDMHGHLFSEGDYLLFHDDVVEGRKIAYVMNLSEGFAVRDGGRFNVYDTKKSDVPVLQIIPEFNTFVCFKVSEKSMHEVEEVKSEKKRLSLSGWFYGN